MIGETTNFQNPLPKAGLDVRETSRVVVVYQLFIYLLRWVCYGERGPQEYELQLPTIQTETVGGSGKS